MDYKKLTRIIDSLDGQNHMSEFKEYASSIANNDSYQWGVSVSEDSDSDFVTVTLTDNDASEYPDDGGIADHIKAELPDVDVDSSDHSIVLSVPKSYFEDSDAYGKLVDVMDAVCMYGFGDAYNEGNY